MARNYGYNSGQKEINKGKRTTVFKGLQFLQSYTPQGHSVLLELLAGLEMTLGGRWNSGYKVIMPSNERGYRRVRLANHPFELSEWPIHEEDGLPNERYSIFIYNEKTCPQFANVPHYLCPNPKIAAAGEMR